MNIGIVGLGLIGGSIAKALQLSEKHRIFGADLADDVIHRALVTETINEKLSEDNIAECEFLIIAIYPDGVLKWLKEHGKNIKEGTIVIDTCGIKGKICPEAEQIAKENNFFFIGAHPMAGVEHAGFDYAKVDLFHNASMILTPPSDTLITVLEVVNNLALEMGFTHVEITTPQHHDEMIAYTSQLAHVVSSAYVKSPLSLEHKGYSAGSYRDMTRVATLNEDMWTKLFLDNADALAKEIDDLIARISPYSEAIKNHDSATLRQLLRDGRLHKEAADGKVL